MLVPRAHQIEAKNAILSAKNEGKPGFLLGDYTGLGKTLTTWLAVSEMEEQAILIVCPRGALSQWRTTIQNCPKTHHNITLTTYGKTKHLLTLSTKNPAKSTRAKNKFYAKNARPQNSAGIVIFDEAHNLRNPDSQRTLCCTQIAKTAIFQIYLSATAGQHPFEVHYLTALIEHHVAIPNSHPKPFQALMKDLRIGTPKGRWRNWKWNYSKSDLTTIAELLFTGTHPIGIRRYPEDIRGWPSVQRELTPVTLEPGERKLYKENWRVFRKAFELEGGSIHTRNAQMAAIRFRQKASLIRVTGTAIFADDLINNGHQVAISVQYTETCTALQAKLQELGWKVSTYTGLNHTATNEHNRLAFQTGNLDAIVFTVSEAISLHQHELPGGERPRSLLIHDVRYSPIDLTQIEGRCHRDGQKSIIYYAYAEDTIEETIAKTALTRIRNMSTMSGDDTAFVDDLLQQLQNEQK